MNRFGWFTKLTLPVCFSAIVLRSFAPSQDTFESRQKIRTTVVCGAWERKSRSSVCRRSNFGLPICRYPFLMQSTVLRIFTNALNITFFLITLYSLQFMIHAKTKPNNGLSGVAFSWAFFFRFVASQPHQFCQISCANNQQVEHLKQLVHCSLLGKFPTHQHRGLCCIHCVFCSFRNSNLPMFSMEVPFGEIFFLSNL